jgi:hypothetical protein
LPEGTKDIVVKIVTKAGSDLPCTDTVAIDNIELMPIVPDINISVEDNSDAWITSTCYVGNKPVNISGNISNSYLDFETSEPVNSSYTNPAVQWQQSVDDGYTRSDITGETNMHLRKYLQYLILFCAVTCF